MLRLQYVLLLSSIALAGWSFNHVASNGPVKKVHPFYVSVVQIDQNEADNILEISCKIFTDDFENTLKMHYKNHYDLLNPTNLSATNKIIDDYITKHLALTIDGKSSSLQFVGFEKNEDAIECYFQVNSSVVKKTISVFNNLLFEYKPEQVNIVHVTVNNTRKSRKLSNPESTFSFDF